MPPRKYHVAKKPHRNNTPKHYPRKPHKKTHHKQTRNPFFGKDFIRPVSFDTNKTNFSGHVVRVMIVKDRYGNQQIAKEKQFFNSGKDIGLVEVDDDIREF